MRATDVLLMVLAIEGLLVIGSLKLLRDAIVALSSVHWKQIECLINTLREGLR